MVDPRAEGRDRGGPARDAEASTIVIRPSPMARPQARPVPANRGRDRRPRHWRAYSLTADPDHPDGLISITVKHVEGGISPHFTRGSARGDRLPRRGRGTFGLPDPLPEKVLFVWAGSGVTPMMSMVRELERRDALDATSSTCTASGRREHDLRRDDARHRRAQPRLRAARALHRERGRLARPPSPRSAATGASVRHTSGPGEMLDAIDGALAARGRPRAPPHGALPAGLRSGPGRRRDRQGGTVRFRVTDVEATCEQGISILVGGEDAGATWPSVAGWASATPASAASPRPAPGPADRRGPRRAGRDGQDLRQRARGARGDRPLGSRLSPRPPSREPAQPLSPEQIDQIGREFEAIHDEVFEDLGEADAGYIRSVIEFHRRLLVLSRVVLMASRYRDDNKIAKTAHFEALAKAVDENPQSADLLLLLGLQLFFDGQADRATPLFERCNQLGGNEDGAITGLLPKPPIKPAPNDGGRDL